MAAAVILALGLGVAAGIAYLHRQSAPMPGGPQGLTPVEQAELRQLEARPLVDLPPLAADGSCPAGPTSRIQPYRAAGGTIDVDGAGPAYGQGGTEIDTAKATYHDVTIFTDPTGRGVGADPSQADRRQPPRRLGRSLRERSGVGHRHH